MYLSSSSAVKKVSLDVTGDALWYVQKETVLMFIKYFLYVRQGSEHFSALTHFRNFKKDGTKL